jgi:23S rRNA (adenine1618-N6)-methyltransferase
MTPNISKKGLHENNPHRFPYNFDELTAAVPALKPFVIVGEQGQKTIDFTNATGVKLLNNALLKHYYAIANWAIPSGYLCPPIPIRVKYQRANA